MIPAPGQSIYMWMYRQGLRQRPLREVTMDLMCNGHDVRPKDIRNYWNGWYRHDLYFGSSKTMVGPEPLMGSRVLDYSDYPVHPYLGQPEIVNCFVPCNADNKPMVKWGSGTMTLADARAWPGCVYLAENLKGSQRIVIDVDGDHGEDLDVETLRFFDEWRTLTCCHEKRSIVFDWYCENRDGWAGDLHTAMLPTSYHLTFGVDRVIPTMHFPEAHVDIVGNQRNSLRYFKDKTYNGLPPMMMDDALWDRIFRFIEMRGGRL